MFRKVLVQLMAVAFLSGAVATTAMAGSHNEDGNAYKASKQDQKDQDRKDRKDSKNKDKKDNGDKYKNEHGKQSADREKHRD